MDSLDRQGDTYEIVYILAKVKILSLRNIGLLERSLDRDFQILETPVALDSHGALDHAFRIHGHTVIVKRQRHLDVSVENIGIPEIAKERSVGRPVVMAYSRGQGIEFNYKGLQR